MSHLLTLDCTQDQFEALHAALDRATKSDSVKVTKAALAALLSDHSATLAVCDQAGIKRKQA